MSEKIRRDWVRNKTYYFILLPVLLFYIIFYYLPMGGLVIAFQDFRPALGIGGSKFIGLKNFNDFFGSYYFIRLLRNTVIISLLSLFFGCVGPVTLALLLNEVQNKPFKKAVQSITYMPYFIAVVVVASLVKIFVAPEGPIGQIVASITGREINLLSVPKYFRPILICSDLWQLTGYSAVIYLSALSGIDSELYEAARIDGAGYWKQAKHITLPGIAPTIIMVLILRTGQLLNFGYEKILLLYSPAVYSTADVIQTFVYRKGLLEGNYGYATAVSMFNSIAGLIMIMISNALAKRYSETQLF